MNISVNLQGNDNPLYLTSENDASLVFEDNVYYLVEGDKYFWNFGFNSDSAIENLNISLSVDGITFYSDTCNSIIGDQNYNFYTPYSFQAGTYEITFTLDSNNAIEEDNEEDNSCYITLNVEGNDDYLLDTFWSQSGYFFPNSDVELNIYCPILEDETHCVTGCGNTAAAQILYYFTTKEDVNFSIVLDEEDAYDFDYKYVDAEGNNQTQQITIDATEETAEKLGYLSFNEVNELLAKFDATSANDIAALVFASGVLSESMYSSGETSSYTNLHQNVFERAGFDSEVAIDNDNSNLIKNGSLTEDAWKIIQNNIKGGKPILFGFAEIAHAVVIDGYDSENELYHINFGWGFEGNKPLINPDLPGLIQGSGWYSKDEINAFVPNCMIYDITPDTKEPTISISPKYNKDKTEVTLTINPDDNIGVKDVYYQVGSKDDDGWLEVDDELTFYKNCTVFFKVVDRQFNGTIESFTIESIYVPIKKPQISLSTNQMTNENITVSAIFDSDSILNEYSFDEENWEKYTDSTTIIIEENCKLWFRSTDEKGNVVFEDISINNIDKVAPTLNITGNPETFTNQNVTLIAQNNEGIVEYSFDGQNWFNGLSVTVEDNTTVYFRATDFAGNVAEATVVVYKIDKEVPVLTIEGNPSGWTNSNVNLTTTVNDNYDANVFYKKEGEEEFKEYSSFDITENGTYYFYAEDTAGNRTEIQTIVVDKIDKVAPELTIPEIDTKLTNQNISLKVSVTDNVDVDATIYYSLDDGNYTKYTGELEIAENGTYYFYAEDIAGNRTETQTITVNNIDKVAPEFEITPDNDDYTKDDVTLTLNFTNSTEDLSKIYHKVGDDENGTWVEFTENSLTVSENGIHYFKSEDTLGNVFETHYDVNNIDKVAPDAITSLTTQLSNNSVTVTWDKISDNLSGVANYYIDYTINGVQRSVSSTENSFAFNDLISGTYTYRVQSFDKAGNCSEWSNGQFFNYINFSSNGQSLSWNIGDSELSVKGVSLTNAKGTFFINTNNQHIDFYGLTGSYTSKWYDTNNVAGIENITVIGENKTNYNGNYNFTANDKLDVFFVQTNKIWSEDYIARHNGSGTTWEGTKETVSLKSKNKIESIYVGSTDANMLVLTDSKNGDALFIEDIYSNAPEGVENTTARISQIDKIYAGDGDDIVDLTYKTKNIEEELSKDIDADAITVYGGNGNDTIWGGNNENTLLGDAGNDRLVGNAKDDIIIGGIGNDSMHGGGGSDIFIFGGDFGKDTIEQLENGSVTIYIQDGSEEYWKSETLTYTQGNNSIKVIGSNITINFKFNDFETLPEGAFDNFATENIFNKDNNNNNGSLA